MSISKHLLALALGACLAAPASAQESLIEVYQRALMNDPAIREAEATYLANAEVKPQARSALLPTLNLGATRRHTFHRSPRVWRRRSDYGSRAPGASSRSWIRPATS